MSGMLEAVREEGLLAPGTAVVAMLSGGRDSVCLLDIVTRLLGVESVTALHVNYGLRDDSDEDEQFCVGLCQRLGVELEVEHPRRPEGSGNLQAWARDARYAAAAKLALGGDDLIATGHTADDQVETILYRLASSPSRRALLGMRRADGRLVRPLLGFTRAETTAYCEERGLEWRDDPTNDADAYARNRVRHGLAAALAEVHPAAASNVLRTAELLRDEAEVLDELVDAELGAATGHPATRSSSAASPSCRRRCGGWSSSSSPTAPPGARSPAPPTTPRRSPACAAPAPRCSTSAAASAPSSSGGCCMRSVERASRGGPWVVLVAIVLAALLVAASTAGHAVSSDRRQAQRQVVQRLRPHDRRQRQGRQRSPSPANGRRPSMSRPRVGSPATRSGPGSAISASSTSPSIPAGCDPTGRVTRRASAATRRPDASTATASSSGRSGSAARVATRRSRSTHAFGRVAPVPRSLCGLVGPAHAFDGVESSPGWPTAIGAVAFTRAGIALFRAGHQAFEGAARSLNHLGRFRVPKLGRTEVGYEALAIGGVGKMDVFRLAIARGGRGSYDFSESPRNLEVSPPPPFSGVGRYRSCADQPWSGSLAVSLPGAGRVGLSNSPGGDTFAIANAVPEFHESQCGVIPLSQSRLQSVSDSEVGEVLVEAEDLQRRVVELGAEISADYKGRDLVMVGVLKGAVIFLADLMRHISVPCEIDFMAVSSYGSATDSSGVVRILKDLDAPIAGRNVLIVEDIIDSGLTLHYLMRSLNAREPASLEVCTLLAKPDRLRVELEPRYVGFEIPNRFAIGYGLDHAQHHRNLDFVAALKD